MERKYLIATHGKLASGFQSSLNILADKGDQVEVINAYLDASDFTKQLNQFVDSIEENQQGIIFTDLLGGSVNQKAVTKKMEQTRENLFIITNTNLAIILAILFCTEPLNREKIKEMIQECQVQLLDLSNSKEDEESFFN